LLSKKNVKLQDVDNMLKQTPYIVFLSVFGLKYCVMAGAGFVGRKRGFMYASSETFLTHKTIINALKD